MSASDTALIVIDVQESFRQRPYWSDEDVPLFLTRLQALIHGARKQGIPVVQVFHVEDEGAFSIAALVAGSSYKAILKTSVIDCRHPGRHCSFLFFYLEKRVKLIFN
jgi:nicotinamidase-related amidase